MSSIPVALSLTIHCPPPTLRAASGPEDCLTPEDGKMFHYLPTCAILFLENSMANWIVKGIKWEFRQWIKKVGDEFLDNREINQSLWGE